MEDKVIRSYYSALLKRQVVREYESGCFSKQQLMDKYGILGSTTLNNWLKVYGHPKIEFLKTLRVKRKKKAAVSASGADTESKAEPVVSARHTEQLRIRELEAQLAVSKQREALYLRVIELGSESVGEDLLKKIGIGLSKVPVAKDG